MEFEKFKELQQKHVSEILENQGVLFAVDVDKDELWEKYLDSFPAEDNKVYRERREFDCSCCKQFVRNFGNIVVIKDCKLVTIWDFQVENSTYKPVVEALSKFIRSAKIKNVFVTKEGAFGVDHTLERLEDKSVTKWHHFRVDLPKRFVTSSSKTVDSVMSELRAVKEVFKRSLEEISEDAINTILELISQKSLYKGEEWEGALGKFLELHKEYHRLPSEKQDTFCWIRSVEVGGAIGKIKNHSIGVLLTDITKEEDLDVAVKRYEKIVAPTNYKRPKAIFTKKMIEQAQKTISDLGYTEALGRRYAAMDDIGVNNILFANRDSMKVIDGNVFDELRSEVKTSNKKFDKLEKIPVETFINDVLPTVTDIEVFVENKHTPNLISLIAPKDPNSKTMFKWSNNFSWAYNGNITDSMKERVKAAGGKVDGVLRFSIQWNEKNDNRNDFDAHCIEPDNNLIFFENKGRKHRSTGMLDVDIVSPGSDVAVENITWDDEGKMQEGEYTFLVHNYCHNGGRSGFSAEIEYGGQIYSYEYRKDIKSEEKVIVAKIQYSRKEGIKFIGSLPSTMSSKTVWGIATQQFQPVSVCMYSPNYWDQQSGVGNKHYFFIVNNCKNENKPNGFFNEFLKEELMEHKRVFEALGSKMRVEDADNQLSGLGFSSTKRNSLVCKLKGSFDRVVEIVF